MRWFYIFVLLYICSLIIYSDDSEDQQDYYEVLGLNYDATDAEIKKAYRKLSLQYHPDKLKKDDKMGHDTFRKISRASEILSDPEKRQIYDLEGFEGLENAENNQGRPEGNSIFDAFFGGGGGGKPKGPDAFIDVTVTLEELYNGAEKSRTFSRNIICRKCRGTGAKNGKTKKCKKCQGQGAVLVNQQMAPGFNVQMQQTCPVCGGKGKVFKKKCNICHGHKVIADEKTLTATIERGMPSNHQIVFEKASEQKPGMVPGNIIFKLHQQPHQHFRRNGDDLHYELLLSLGEALLGHSKEIVQLDQRKVQITNDSIIQPFQVNVIKNEGMPINNVPSLHGDLHVLYKIIYPKALSEIKRDLVKKLLEK